jgi:hypothetical protein
VTPRRAKKQARRASAERVREGKVQARIAREAPRIARAWLDQHPPRAEPAIEFGKWDHRLPGDRPRYEVEFFGMRRDGDGRWRPEQPVVRVPVMDHRHAEMFTTIANRMPGYMADIEMRAVRMGMRVNDTEVRWYNWEPTRGMFGDSEADIYRAAGKVEAFLSRVCQMLRFLPPDEILHTAEFGPMPAGLGLEWMQELIDGIRQWRGRVGTFYAVPGQKPGDPPEERATR